ncbi:MAG: Crp/Fnr family transcriptional regulator [Sphingobacteriaceae bacterium]|nr:MAG: Crp/Fnr family transcriptional regulator [Sphingobacteriaceae bacterium]
MNTVFENYLRLHTILDPEEIGRVSQLAVVRKLSRNQSILNESEVCRHKAFIVSGLLRTFALRPDGSEHILQFNPENTWTLDVESYDRQTPSNFNISAVEPSEVLLWPKVEFERLLAELPGLKFYAGELISRNIYNSRQRLLTILSATPEEKYEDLVKNSPQLLSRLPLRMIASYLGISLKTLTRVRKAQLSRT